MADSALTLLKWGVRIGIVVASILAFLALLALGVSYLAVGLNLGILTDVFSFIQMWLPFDLNVVLLWLITATSAWLLYRVTRMGINYINDVLGDS